MLPPPRCAPRVAHLNPQPLSQNFNAFQDSICLDPNYLLFIHAGKPLGKFTIRARSSARAISGGLSGCDEVVARLWGKVRPMADIKRGVHTSAVGSQYGAKRLSMASTFLDADAVQSRGVFTTMLRTRQLQSCSGSFFSSPLSSTCAKLRKHTLNFSKPFSNLADSRYKSWKITVMLPWCALTIGVGYILREVGAFKYNNVNIYIASMTIIYSVP
jgi:hypothetical protein